MKFRRLSLNPFLRVKSKSKKKNSKKTDISTQPTGGQDTSGHVTERVDLDLSSLDHDFVQVKESDIVDLDLDNRSLQYLHEENFDKGQGYAELSVDIKSQYRLQLDDYFYPIGDEGCHCDTGIDYTSPCDHFLADEDVNHYSSGSSLHDRPPSDFDPYSTTIRKVRSRIKTNPWLPSPKLSPLSLSAPSEALSSSDADSGSEGSPDDRTDDFRDKEEKDVIEQRKDFSNLTSKPKVKDSLQSGPPIQDVSYRWSIISEGDIDLTSPTIEALPDSFSNLEYKISFEYEDNVDSVLESDVTAPRSLTCLSINDLLDDSLIQSDDSSSLQTSSEDISSGAEMSSSRVSNSMTESEAGASTESDNGDSFDDMSPAYEVGNAFHVKVCSMDDSIDAGYSSLSRDSRMSSDSDSDSYTNEKKLQNVHSNSGGINEGFLEDDEKLIEQARVSADTYEEFADDLRKCNAPTSRTFSEVRLSLEEKVHQLRLEKMVVEQKIREAQEAEKIRLQEKLRFKQQMSEQRKEVLLQTLNSLKDRLESQSERLEQNYSEVLNMQEKYSRRRQPFLFVSPTEVSS